MKKHGTYPTYDQLRSSWSGNIIVDAEKNNSCKVVVYVRVTDNAGKVNDSSLALDIDVTPPTVEVSYADENPCNKLVGERGYFPGYRVATVVITEREGHFNAENAVKGIKITAVDSNGQPVEGISYSDTENRIVDNSFFNKNAVWFQGSGSDKHTATIIYSDDANYTFEVGYTDLAGWSNTDNEVAVNTGDSVAPYEFTVDRTERQEA